MDKKYVIDLTKIVYKLTLLFPKKEPLRYKIREAADDILASFISAAREGSVTMKDTVTIDVTRKDTVTLVDVLDGFFEVAKAQNWVQKDQILEIQKEYGKLREASSSYNKGNPVTAKEPKPLQPLMSERQERIMLFLREQGRAQVWQIKEILPEVTKRTLRRDFDALLKQGLIERVGERNNTFYQIKTV